MTETNVQKFYRILAEKTKTYGTKKEMMVQLGFEGAKLNSDRTRLNGDERAGRFPPVRLMIKLDSLFDRDFLITCLREKMDCKTVDKRWAAAHKITSTIIQKSGGRRAAAKRSANGS